VRPNKLIDTRLSSVLFHLLHAAGVVAAIP